MLAKLLDTIEFSEVMNIVDKIDNGKYDILPYITRVKSTSDTINPYNLSRCSRVETVILPNCNMITDNVLMLLPYLESLTIKSGSMITEDTFRYLNYLTKLQIISHHEHEPDTVVTMKSLSYMTKLEMLHLRNEVLRNEHFYHMRNLKVLILDGNKHVTPDILNYLPKLEIFVLNKKLYKYISSEKNNEIIKKIGKLNKVKIYTARPWK